MKTHYLKYSIAAALAGATLLSPEAFAQDSAERVSLDEVTVTARRVEENMQDVPVSVSAFTAADLEKRMILNTEQLDEVTPNLQFTNNTTLAGNNSSSNIFIRGIGQVDPTSTVDPGVGMYIDDVYMGQSIGGTLDFRDISSVQVLRGPQGTLFGKNSVGGAIVINTARPGDGNRLRVGTGTDSLVDVFGAFDIPMSDTINGRVSVGYRNQEGYVTRVQTGEDLGDTNTWTVTGKLLFEPNEDFEAMLSFDVSSADENGNPFVFAAANPDAIFQKAVSRDAGCPGYVFPGPVPQIDDPRCSNNFQDEGPYANNGTFPLTSETDSFGIALNARYDLNEDWNLASVTSYRSLDWVGIRDADNTPFPTLHTSYDVESYQFSQEFRAQYVGDSLTGTVGAFYFQDESDDIVRIELYPPPGLQRDSDDNVAESENIAVFTQWTYDLTDAFSLTGGVRWTQDRKSSTPDQYNLATPDNKWIPNRKYTETFTNTSIMLSASYRFTEKLMTYASYSQAFKGGGWNSHFNQPVPPDVQAVVQQFQPEEAETYEIGFKADLIDNTLRLNGAVFSTDYDDLQFTYRYQAAPFLTNAGKASINGAELELNYISGNVTVDAGIGYLDTGIDSLTPPPEEFSFLPPNITTDNVLPFSPELQFNIGIGVNGEIGDWIVQPRIDFSHRGKTYWDANNTEEIAVDSEYNLVNTSVVIGPMTAPWSIRASVMNLGDELYSTGGNSSLTTGSGYAEIAYARGRQWYVTFDYDF